MVNYGRRFFQIRSASDRRRVGVGLPRDRGHRLSRSGVPTDRNGGLRFFSAQRRGWLWRTSGDPKEQHRGRGLAFHRFLPPRGISLGELCCCPNRKDPQGNAAAPPHFLHWALALHGTTIVSQSDEAHPSAASPPERFCSYWGRAWQAARQGLPAQGQLEMPARIALGRAASALEQARRLEAEAEVEINRITEALDQPR